jgi:MscS family membrane protein
MGYILVCATLTLFLILRMEQRLIEAFPRWRSASRFNRGRLWMAATLLAATMGSVPSHAADPSWTGVWDTRWRDGGARMELLQSGAKVSGQYSAYGGQITGEVDGRELKGRWIEGGRSGGIDFVLAPDGQSFMGRFDTGEWWTGGRITKSAAESLIDQSGARETLKSFIDAGNAARLGAPDQLAKAAAVIDFGAPGATMAPGEKIEAARGLFDLVDLATFRLWTIPGKRAGGDRLDLVLQQAGTAAALPLTLAKKGEIWYISLPDSATLANARKALLARFGGHFPPPEDYKRRRSARDAVRSFIAAFSDWDRGGRDRALDALDLSFISEAVRDYEGELAAQYLKEVLDRVGVTVPQEISDDPNDPNPYIAFSHPVGRIVVSTNGVGEALSWKFTSDTVQASRDLYAAVEDMPRLSDEPSSSSGSAYFVFRDWIRSHCPIMLDRFGELEAWQAVGWVAVFAISFLLGFALGALILAIMRRLIGGAEYDAERQFRWPLRLALTFSIYKLIIPVIGLPEIAKRFSVGGTGVLLALALMWGGWRLINLLTDLFFERAAAKGAALDNIMMSLAFGAIKLGLVVGGLVFIAIELSLPYNSLLASLSIGGLAVAFASRETLSNIFGAGILAIDRPFKRGDWIVAGDAQGVVEQVGIRSTRIRTGQDSLIVIPNGKLSDAILNNLGSRRYHLTSAKLPLSYATSASQIKAFQDGVKGLIGAMPQASLERSQVIVVALNPECIEVEVTVSIDSRKASDEITILDALMLEILRLGEQLGVRFGDQTMRDQSIDQTK